jgi:hypothetical protein
VKVEDPELDRRLERIKTAFRKGGVKLTRPTTISQ